MFNKGKAMTSWYSKDLGDGVAAFAPSGQIQEAFLRFAVSGVAPHELAVFSRYDLERNVVTAYFTPAAEVMAQELGAVPCQKPIRTEGFGLLVGDTRAWDIFFPT